MRATFKSLIYLSVFTTSCAYAAAQPSYVGEYTQRSSSDPASAEHLFLLANGDFAIVVYGGGITGTWKLLPDGSIVLNELRGDAAEFILYGRTLPGRKPGTHIKFSNFESRSSKVGFTSAGPGPMKLQPVSDRESSCDNADYSITRPSKDMPALALAALPQAHTGARDEDRSFVHALYTFDLRARKKRCRSCWGVSSVL